MSVCGKYKATEVYYNHYVSIIPYKGVMHNEVARIQTDLHDKAGVAPYYVAKDKESVFIGTLFYFAQNKTLFLCSFHKIRF